MVPAQWTSGGLIASEGEVGPELRAELASKLLPELPHQQQTTPAGVLVLGDSISAAYGIDKSRGWVALLSERLREQCVGVGVYNASVSGETTAGGLNRLPGLLARLKPPVVVIELGGNDGLRGLSPGQMQSNFEAMVRLVRKAGGEPVLLGMLIPPNYGETYRQLFEQAIAAVASAEQVPFVKFFLEGVGDQPHLMQEDGVHPTAEAQATLLDNAWGVLERPLAAICADKNDSGELVGSGRP